MPGRVITLLNRWRLVCVLGVVALVLGLLVGGAQPVAVGLLAEPWDKLAHATVFAVLAAMTALTLRGARPMGLSAPISQTMALTLALLGCVALAGADELHQRYLPGRVASWDDLLADVVGMAAALLGVRWVWGR